MEAMDSGMTEREILEASGRASVPLCGKMADILSPEVVPLAVPRSRQTAEVREALDHYFRCGRCRSAGLVSFLEKEMACETALLVFARNLGPIFVHLRWQESLEIVLAVEHVCSFFSECRMGSCAAFHEFWFNPIGANRGSRAHTAHELAVLHQIFREARFSGITEIRRLMRERVAALVERLRSRQWVDEEFAFIKMEMDAICDALVA